MDVDQVYMYFAYGISISLSEINLESGIAYSRDMYF